MLSARVAREAVVPGAEVGHLVQPAAALEVEGVVDGDALARCLREAAGCRLRGLCRGRLSGGGGGGCLAALHRVIPRLSALHVMVALGARKLAGAGRGAPVAVREHVLAPLGATEAVVQAQGRDKVSAALDCLLVDGPRVAAAVGVLNRDGRVVTASGADPVAAGVGAVGVVDVLHDVAVAVDRVVGRTAVGTPDAVALAGVEVAGHVVDGHALDAERAACGEVAPQKLVLVRLDVREVCHVSPP